MDRSELESLDRETLVSRAIAAGIRRARILTRPEIIDELLRLDPNADEATLRRTRGFFGRARDLLSKVVERGLHLPDAIDKLVTPGTLPPSVPRTEPQAVPTVTLAEIYAAQGHKERALETLRRVLEREPEHTAARALLERLSDAAYVPPPPPLPPEPEIEPVPADAEPEDDDEDSTPGPASSTPAVTRETPIDEHCIAIPLGRAVHVSWRVAGEAELVLRAVIIVASWDGPRRDVRDVPLAEPEGELVLRGIPEGAVVRVAVGTMQSTGFSPRVHSPAVERDGERLAMWTPKGAVPLAAPHPRAAEILRCAEAARRALIAAQAS